MIVLHELELHPRFPKPTGTRNELRAGSGQCTGPNSINPAVNSINLAVRPRWAIMTGNQMQIMPFHFKFDKIAMQSGKKVQINFFFLFPSCLGFDI